MNVLKWKDENDYFIFFLRSSHRVGSTVLLPSFNKLLSTTIHDYALNYIREKRHPELFLEENRPIVGLDCTYFPFEQEEPIVGAAIHDNADTAWEYLNIFSQLLYSRNFDELIKKLQKEKPSLETFSQCLLFNEKLLAYETQNENHKYDSQKREILRETHIDKNMPEISWIEGRDETELIEYAKMYQLLYNKRTVSVCIRSSLDLVAMQVKSLFLFCSVPTIYIYRNYSRKTFTVTCLGSL